MRNTHRCQSQLPNPAPQNEEWFANLCSRYSGSSLSDRLLCESLCPLRLCVILFLLFSRHSSVATSPHRSVSRTVIPSEARFLRSGRFYGARNLSFPLSRHSPLLPTALFPEPSFRAKRGSCAPVGSTERGISLFLSVLSVFSVSSVLIPFLPLNFQLLTFNLSICASLFSVTSVLNSYSPAAAVFRDSSLSPSGIPSFEAAVSSSNSSRASISALAAFSVASSAFAPGLLSLATRHSSLATSPAGANPSSLPNASRASASNSFKLGSSSRSLNPNRIKNSFDVLYKIGRPITSLRPAVVIRCLSSSVLITPEVFTPRISKISGDVTGCLYAITASVSSAGMDSRSGGRKLLMNRRTTSWCCGLVYILYPPATARISIPRSSAA